MQVPVALDSMFMELYDFLKMCIFVNVLGEKNELLKLADTNLSQKYP